MEKLWIVVPVYNEEESIVHVVSEWIPVLRSHVPQFTFCILNDGSIDKTFEILENLKTQYPEIRVVNKTNTGHGQTCIYGYRLALEEGADWIFQMDSDGQCDPQYFAKFWESRQEFPVIYGYRFKRDDGYKRYLISRFVSFVTWLSSGIWVRDPNVPYRLMRADAVRLVLEKIPPNFHLANIALAALQQKNIGIHWLNFRFRDRFGGTPSAKALSFVKRGVQLFQQLRGIKDFGDRKRVANQK